MTREGRYSMLFAGLAIIRSLEVHNPISCVSVNEDKPVSLATASPPALIFSASYPLP
jgi:hypothetical protein